MRITIIQTDLHWENSEENLKSFTKKILPLKDKTDLIAFPEMFTTGFSMQPIGKAEKYPGRTLDWMIDCAAKVNAAIVGSIMAVNAGKYFNRLIFAKPDGSFQFVDKRHLFRMADENKNYSHGEKRLIIEWKGWRFLPLICYDLRFPIWSRNIPINKVENKIVRKGENLVYDVLLYVANWPERRSQAWNTLLPARAVENLSYVVAVNRIGTDGTGLSYSGDSAVYDYLGNRISTTQSHSDSIETIELNKIFLEEFRIQFPAWKDADKITIL